MSAVFPVLVVVLAALGAWTAVELGSAAMHKFGQWRRARLRQKAGLQQPARRP